MNKDLQEAVFYDVLVFIAAGLFDRNATRNAINLAYLKKQNNDYIYLDSETIIKDLFTFNYHLQNLEIGLVVDLILNKFQDRTYDEIGNLVVITGVLFIMCGAVGAIAGSKLGCNSRPRSDIHRPAQFSPQMNQIPQC